MEELVPVTFVEEGRPEKMNKFAENYVPLTRKLALFKEMDEEFGKKMKVAINNLPPDYTENDLRSLIPDHSYSIIGKIVNGSVHLIFPTPSQAIKGIQAVNRLNKDKRDKRLAIQASYCRPDSLLFIGNIPLWFNKEDLRQLFTPLGTILRSLIVYSIARDVSKGYGFVEFSTRDEAVMAKYVMATKEVGGRHLRVDFADNGMVSTSELHSKTLFVDKLPKNFSDNIALKRMFEVYGVVNFCQIAVFPNGTSRCFAFIDFDSSVAAEEAHHNLNGRSLHGHEIRVSYSMPCRPGACILQPKPVGNPLGGVPPPTSIPTPLQEMLLPLQLPPLPLPTPTIHLQSQNCSTHDRHHQSIIHRQDPPLSVISISTCTAADVRTAQEEKMKENVVPTYTILKAGNKRSSEQHIVKDNTSLSDMNNMSYIHVGQHDQGIPFTHPLKRIKTGS